MIPPLKIRFQNMFDNRLMPVIKVKRQDTEFYDSHFEKTIIFIHVYVCL